MLQSDSRLRVKTGLSLRELLTPLLAGGLTVVFHFIVESRHIGDNADHFRSVIIALSASTIAIIFYIFEVSSAARKASIEDFIEVNEGLKDVRAELVERFDAMNHFRYLGNATNTLDDVMAMARNASIVRNTFVWFGISESRFFDESYTPAQLSDSRSVTRAWLASNKDKSWARWIDLVSDAVLRSSRVNWLAFWASLGEAERNKYSLHRVNENYPIINFMILEHENPALPTKVIFGWGHHPHDVAGHVFESEDENIVEMFSKYWHTLLDDSNPFDGHSRPIVVTAPDISDVWYRAAYDAPEGWQPGNGIPAGATLKSVALVHIREEQNRRIAVSGSIFNPVTLDKVRTFRSVATDLVKNEDEPLEVWRLYFSTLADNRRLLAGFYQFANSRGPISDFEGEYHDELVGEGRKLAIIGRRVSSTWLPPSVIPESIQEALSHPTNLLVAARESWKTRT